jgi:hypothetical protein
LLLFYFFFIFILYIIFLNMTRITYSDELLAQIGWGEPNPEAEAEAAANLAAGGPSVARVERAAAEMAARLGWVQQAADAMVLEIGVDVDI